MNNTTHPSQPMTLWLRLVEYGTPPHPRGSQRVTREAAEAMARRFNSLHARLARRLGGLPIFIGHPDEPTPSLREADTRAYAWVIDRDDREDGLWMHSRWSERGRQLLANAHYKFLSPRWKMTPTGKGHFIPHELVSVGLTNNPNIPGDAIEIQNSEFKIQKDEPAESSAATASAPSSFNKVGDEPSDATLVANQSESRNPDDAGDDGSLDPAIAQQIDRLTSALDEAKERIGELETQLEDASKRLQQIAEEERPAAFQSKGKNSASKNLSSSDATEDASLGEQLALANSLPSASRLPSFTPGNPCRPNSAHLSAVHQRITQTGEDFATAWHAVRLSRG